MARTIKLPARSNAQSFEPTEVADVRLSLLNPELPKGEGVVIADATDTAPKARVRNRNMVKLLGEAQDITEGMIPDEFWTGEADEEENATLPEWIVEFETTAEDAEEDTERTFSLPAIEVKAHTVAAEGDTFYPVLSLKA